MSKKPYKMHYDEWTNILNFQSGEEIITLINLLVDLKAMEFKCISTSVGREVLLICRVLALRQFALRKR